MSDTLEPLVFDLVEWVARQPRTYNDVLEAWRTSCPRLPVWEEAVERGLLRRDAASHPDTTLIVVTDRGQRFLAEARRQ